jgi:hypothetical protein
VNILWWRKKLRPSKPFVIGEQLARARRVERARLSNPNVGPSPLPASLHYNRSLGDLDLTDPPKHPLDDELCALCRRFAASDLDGRSRLRDSASMQDFYTLLSFSQRSAVFAMRDRKTERIVDGLTAVAMIEKSRIDFRDALGTLSLLLHAALAIGANVEGLFGNAASLAAPEISELIQGFLKRSENERDIQKSWGYAVVETKAGPGFVGWEFNVYQPSCPLDQIALALAGLVKQDKYLPAAVTLASDLPAVWLLSVDDNTLKNALTSIRGAVKIHADLKPQKTFDYKHQVLMIFLAEFDNETAAAILLRLSEEKQTRTNSFAMVAVSHGRLFCMAVARSMTGGTPPFETRTSMQRFSAGIAAVLQDLGNSAVDS